LTAAVFGVPTEPVRNEDLFTGNAEPHETQTHSETESEYVPFRSEDETPSDEQQEPTDMEYGRGRSRRAEMPESETEEPSGDSEQPSEPEAESTDANPSEGGAQEPPQFGRAPRKRLRH